MIILRGRLRTFIFAGSHLRDSSLWVGGWWGGLGLFPPLLFPASLPDIDARRAIPAFSLSGLPWGFAARVPTSRGIGGRAAVLGTDFPEGEVFLGAIVARETWDWGIPELEVVALGTDPPDVLGRLPPSQTYLG